MTGPDTAKSLRPIVVATSCCISDVPSQWERPNFDPHSSKIWGTIVSKLKFKKHVRGTIPHAKYGKDRIKDVGGANTQFVTTLGIPFFVFFAHRPGSVRELASVYD